MGKPASWHPTAGSSVSILAKRYSDNTLLLGVRWPGTALVKRPVEINELLYQSGAGPPHSKEASCYHAIMKKIAARIVKLVLLAVIITIIATAVRIYTYASVSVDTEADAAVVLGAAVWSNNVSPVFRERINHAIELYRRGKVRKLIFTGGQGSQNEPTEAAAARAYAQANSIPLQDIRI